MPGDKEKFYYSVPLKFEGLGKTLATRRRQNIRSVSINLANHRAG